MKIRPIDQQFPKSVVKTIRQIQSDLSSFPFNIESLWYYSKELKYALESGLILASIQLMMTITEIFFRDLLLYNLVKNQDLLRSKVPDLNRDYIDIETLEIFLEDSTRPKWTFNKITEELEILGILSKRDKNTLVLYYKEIRIPLHHGLTRRFIRRNKLMPLCEDLDDLELLFCGRVSRKHQLEENIENRGLKIIKKLISLIKKYSSRI